MLALMIVGLILASVCADYALGAIQCSAKWGERGVYGLFSGCMVRSQDGTYTPEANVREVR